MEGTFTCVLLTILKGAALFKMTSVKKVVKSKGAPRNGCDGMGMAKILITTILVSFMLIPSEYGMRQHTELKILPSTLTIMTSFWPPPSISQVFFPLAILNRTAPSYTARLLLCRYSKTLHKAVFV